MTPPTYIYVMFWKRSKPKNIKFYNTGFPKKKTEYVDYGLMTYTGITFNINKRIKQHLSLRGCITTRTIIKRYGIPFKIRYQNIGNLVQYEKTFKKYTQKKKLNTSKYWQRWAG